MGVILRCKLVLHNKYNVKIAICQLVPNFLSYVSAVLPNII